MLSPVQKKYLKENPYPRSPQSPLLSGSIDLTASKNPTLSLGMGWMDRATLEEHVIKKTSVIHGYSISCIVLSYSLVLWDL